MKDFKHVIVLLVDMIAIAGSFFLAILINDDFTFIIDHYVNISYEIPFTIVLYIFIFEVFGMYKSLWKYAGFEELIRGIIANLLAINVSYIVLIMIGLQHFNYSYYLIAFFFVGSSTLGVRLSYRFFKFYNDYREDTSSKTRTLIVGAGHAGVMLLDEIKDNKDFDKHVVGFIDDDKDLLGKQIRGVPVLGTVNDVKAIALDKDIDSIILAIPSMTYVETRGMLNKLEESGCKIKMMPPFYEMIGTKQEMFKVRDVKIEDLLGREPIILEETGIREYIDSKVVLVTGGGGSIGSELVRQLRHFNPEKIIIVDIYENNAYDLEQEMHRLYKSGTVKHMPEIVVLIANVRDEARMNEIFALHKPFVVFHAAAHKHVPLMEFSPREAIKNNVLGTYNVATTAVKYKVQKFVLVSTDKAVRPTNVMGASKRIAEKICMALNVTSDTDFAAVRFGNVLGSNGSVIPLFKKQIEEGGPVTVTHPEITRFFMTIPEACQLVIQAGAYAKGGELFVLDMGEPVKILDLAEKLIRLSGHDPYHDIEIQFTGLRPGEKMYEELLKNTDTIVKTKNEKIFIEKNNNGYKNTIAEVVKIKSDVDRLDVMDFIKRNVRSFNHK
jgi:FlaA1/EpsC-like NDP-sugar epimerase